MIKNVLFIVLVAGVVYAAQLGTLNRSSDVALSTDLTTYAVDPNTLQVQIDAINSKLDAGITTNLNGFVVEDGIITGTF